MRLAPLILSAGALLLACKRHPTPDPSQTFQPSTSTVDAGVVVDSALVRAASDAGIAAPERAADAGPPLEFTGTLRGVVKLAKGTTLPLAPPITSHGVEPPSVAPCPKLDKSDQRVVVQSKKGGLSPIHVALTGMRGAPERAPVTHDLYIDACRLRPTIVGAQRGDKVRVTNRSDTALVPSMPGASFMRGLLRGEAQEFEAKSVQSRIRCSFGSYCGESLVIATTHPLYDVTAADGTFTIERVPLDQALKVHAWHPLFRENNVTVTLTHAEPTKTVEILLTPAPAEPVTAPAPEPAREAASKSRVIVRKPEK